MFLCLFPCSGQESCMNSAFTQRDAPWKAAGLITWSKEQISDAQHVGVVLYFCCTALKRPHNSVNFRFSALNPH